MEAHPSAAKLRIALMVVFAAFLSVTISLASSLTSYFAYIIAMLFSAVYKADNIPGWLITLVFATCMAIPLVVILALFWICTLQLVPNFKDRARNKLRKVILSRLRRTYTDGQYPSPDQKTHLQKAKDIYALTAELRASIYVVVVDEIETC